MAPTIAVGMAQHQLGFAGSMPLAAESLIAVPDGRIGSDLGLARPEASRRLCDTAVAGLTENYLIPASSDLQMW